MDGKSGVRAERRDARVVERVWVNRWETGNVGRRTGVDADRRDGCEAGTHGWVDEKISDGRTGGSAGRLGGRMEGWTWTSEKEEV